MAFFGKEYTFDRQKNFEDFVNSLDLSAEQAKGFLNYHPNQKLTQDGDSLTLTTTTPQTKKELNFKSGVSFEEKVADRTCTTTYTLDGNTLTQVQKFDNGAEFTFTRVFSDSELVVTITSNKYNGAARRYYKA